MKNILSNFWIGNNGGARPLFVVCCLLFVMIPAGACTSAIISGRVTKSGRPILWKNRDTSATDNKVEYIAPAQEGELPYVALFNASDTRCEQAWIGMNRAGLAVMNTASYNLKEDDVPDKDMDREGYVMTLALKHCRSVDDFQNLLSELPRPMGVEANFGVIDALGGAAYFECNNHSFKRFDVADAPCGYLIRTNYSHSGRPGEGFGQIRERNAEHLLAPFARAHTVEPYTLTDSLSCSFYHDLYGCDMAGSGATYIVDQDFIPRYTTTASVAIEGVPEGGKADADELARIGERYVMWVAMGYPPCAQLTPVWCRPGGVDEGLRGLEAEGTSRLGNEAKARKACVFDVSDGNRSRYVDLRALRSFMPQLRRQNRDIFDKITRH